MCHWTQHYREHKEGYARLELFGAKLLLCSRLGEWNALAQAAAQVWRRKYELLSMRRIVNTMVCQSTRDLYTRSLLTRLYTRSLLTRIVNTMVCQSTPAEPVQASLLGGGRGKRGRSLRRWTGKWALPAFSRGTNVAEPLFCSAKIAPQGLRRDAAERGFFEPFFSLEPFFSFFEPSRWSLLLLNRSIYGSLF